MTTKTITPEEIEKIKQFQISFNENTLKLGQLTQQISTLESELKILNADKDKVLQEYSELEELEEKLLTELKSVYGDGELNLETGIFTSI